MRQMTREEKELLKKVFNDRLGQEFTKMVDLSWDEANARCRRVLADVFTELLLEKLFDAGQPAENREKAKKPPPPGASKGKKPPKKDSTEKAPDSMVEAPARHQIPPGSAYTYLYCLAPADAAGLFSDQVVPGLPDGGEVRGIVCGRLAAVVGSVPADTYNEESLQDLVQDPRWLEGRVTGHEQVIRGVMEKYPVIPMKFGTIFHSAHRVCMMIAGREEYFEKMLGYVSGREEWGLKAYCQPGLLRRYVEKNSGRAREAMEKLEAMGAGAAYLARKRTDSLLDEEVEKTAASLMDQVHHDLAQMAVEARTNRLLGPEVTGRLEKMSLNAVYLLDCDAVSRFREKVEGLGASHEHMGIEYVLTGPWPPYNFTSAGGPGVEGKS